MENLTACEASDREYHSAADTYRTDYWPVTLHYLKGSMNHRFVLILINDLRQTIYICLLILIL